MDKYVIDVIDVNTACGFWDKYLEVVKPDGARYFGKNLDAFWDALDGGGPGFPCSDESLIRIVNSVSLKSINEGTLFDGLKSISNRLNENSNSVVKLILD